MNIDVRAVGEKYVDVKINEWATSIDLGLLNEAEATNLMISLLNAASEIEHSFRSGSALDKALDVSVALANEISLDK